MWLWHHRDMPNPKHKTKRKSGKNPTDLNLLARAVVEAAIGEPLSPAKTAPKRPRKLKAK